MSLIKDTHGIGFDVNFKIRVSIQQIERFDAIDKTFYSDGLDEYLNISREKEEKIKATKNRVITEKRKLHS